MQVLSGSKNFSKDSSTLQDRAFVHDLAHISATKNWSNLYENFIIDISLDNWKYPLNFAIRTDPESRLGSRKLDRICLGRGLYVLKPTTHAPETGARNQRHKIDDRIWSVCHTIWHASGVNFFWGPFLERVYEA